MANPQLENGYTKLANELLDALVRIRIPGEVRQCVDYVMRVTYGFNRKSARIHLSDMAEATQSKKQNASRSLQTSMIMKLVIKGDDGKYSINKNYEEWQPEARKPRKNVIQSSLVITDNTSSNVMTPVIKDDDALSSLVITTPIKKKRQLKERENTGEKIPPFPLSENLKNSWIEKGMPLEELVKFENHWTEQNAKGRQRWQDEKFFEIGKRLSTWFQNFKKWQRPGTQTGAVTSGELSEEQKEWKTKVERYARDEGLVDFAQAAMKIILNYPIVVVSRAWTKTQNHSRPSFWAFRDFCAQLAGKEKSQYSNIS